MADHTFASGEALTAANMNTYAAHTGGAFNTWTPAVVQSGSVTSTTTVATYHRSGRLITFHAIIAITGSGTGANNVTISLPVTAAAVYGTQLMMMGGGVLQDVSSTNDYSGGLYSASTTTCSIQAGGVLSPNNGRLGVVSFTAALASGDIIRIWGAYEAATG